MKFGTYLIKNSFDTYAYRRNIDAIQVMIGDKKNRDQVVNNFISLLNRRLPDLKEYGLTDTYQMTKALLRGYRSDINKYYEKHPELRPKPAKKTAKKPVKTATSYKHVKKINSPYGSLVIEYDKDGNIKHIEASEGFDKEKFLKLLIASKISDLLG